MLKPEYIILHTAAHGKDGEDYDTSAEDINRWHLNKGWSGIGYHFVIRKTGVIEHGRPVTEQGAHVKGLNARSIGICFSGHGDIQPLTIKQLSACIELCYKLCVEHDIQPRHIKGHREIDTLGLGLETTKSCPGKLVDPQVIRDALISVIR